MVKFAKLYYLFYISSPSFFAASRAPQPPNGYGYTTTVVPGAYGHGGYPPAPAGYAPAPPAGPYPYAPPAMNGYAPQPQPMGYPYALPPGNDCV